MVQLSVSTEDPGRAGGTDDAARLGVVQIDRGLLAVIPAIVLTTACGSVTADTPTSPSSVTTPVPAQNFPSLTGRWRASGRVEFHNLENGNRLTWGGCSGSFTVTVQEGRVFSGSFDTQGQGWNSDRYCTASGTFSGELLAPDGSVAQARFAGHTGDAQNWPRPSVNPSCEFISRGDGIWTGHATGDEIRLQTRDTLRCAVNVDGGLPDMPRADFERTISMTFQR